MSDITSLLELDFEKEITLSKEKIRELIADFETFLATLPQEEIPVNHYFSDGVYVREMKQPAGCIVIGKIHKKQNANILSEGEVTVLSVDGVKRVKAPHTFVADPGAKRVIYAHTNVTWNTIHGTHETDLEKIENEFIAKTYDEVQGIEQPILVEAQEVKCLGQQ